MIVRIHDCLSEGISTGGLVDDADLSEDLLSRSSHQTLVDALDCFTSLDGSAPPNRLKIRLIHGELAHATFLTCGRPAKIELMEESSIFSPIRRTELPLRGSGLAGAVEASVPDRARGSSRSGRRCPCRQHIVGDTFAVRCWSAFWRCVPSPPGLPLICSARPGMTSMSCVIRLPVTWMTPAG